VKTSHSTNSLLPKSNIDKPFSDFLNIKNDFTKIGKFINTCKHIFQVGMLWRCANVFLGRRVGCRCWQDSSIYPSSRILIENPQAGKASWKKIDKKCEFDEFASVEKSTQLILNAFIWQSLKFDKHSATK
jgi:hypothetical protein